MVRLIALLIVCGSLPLYGQNDYSGQVEAIEQMLERGRYPLARAQSQALTQSGEQLHLPDIEARGNYLYGRALLEDPAATAKQRVSGIKAFRLAAAGFKQTGDSEMVGTISTKLSDIGEQVEIPDMQELRRRVKGPEIADNDLDESTLNAIVALQSSEIEALSDTQVRQLLLLKKKDLEINEYEFQVLNDSVLLMRQEMQLEEQRALTQEEKQRRNFFIVLALGVFIALGLLYSRFRSSQRYQRKLQAKNEVIEAERQRSDELLKNILPVRVAEELKSTGRATARRFEHSSVMFSDFVGFSRIAGKLTPEELVGLLDKTFRAFDDILTRHGLEKIKTIGDAYMCASGVPADQADHAMRAVRAALDIQRYLTLNPSFQARIGIHSGPVVAGVVGQQKFAYDIWGDTVNQAARLEASGLAGQVTISRVTKELLDDSFVCTPAGTFEAKNIGTMERFVVVAAATN